jgi:hypothetical protein
VIVDEDDVNVAPKASILVPSVGILHKYLHNSKEHATIIDDCCIFA